MASSPNIQRKRPCFALELNSHSLSYLQKCPELFRLKQIRCLERRGEYYPFKRGSAVSKILQLWYMAKQKDYSKEKLERLEWFLLTKAKHTESFRNTTEAFYRINGGRKFAPKIVEFSDDRMFIASRLMGYFNKYRDEKLPIVGVEKGFSKVIYQDSNVYFVYSGKPDLVMDFGSPYGIGPMDHKTESQARDIYAFNNQMQGYCWAIGANTGFYNYIGLQKDNKDNDVLRREAVYFSNSQIEQWKNDTIGWFYTAMQMVVSKRYPRTWNCEGKYGVCEMHKICEQPTPNGKERIARNDFVTLEEPYKSW